MTFPDRGRLPPQDPKLVARGRVYVGIAVATFLGIAVAAAVLSTLRFGPSRLPTHAVRLLLTAALMYFLYRGARWARWATVGIVVLLFMLVLPAFRGDAWRGDRLGGTLALLALLIVYGVIGRGLLYSQSVAAFLDHQRLRQVRRRAWRRSRDAPPDGMSGQSDPT